MKKITRKQGGIYKATVYIDGLFEHSYIDTFGVIEEQTLLHIMDDQKRIASVRTGHDFGDTKPPIQYFLDDHLGSSNVVLNNSGGLESREEYYPFGETSFGSFAKKRYRFCGKERDEESGLYYYGARYYAPWVCRFVSVDALAHETPFFSPFAYADDNPVMNNDPTGNQTEKANTNGGGGAKSGGGGSSNPKVHAVKEGETLSSIAKQYGTTVDKLRTTNNLSPANDTKLQIGTKLNLPAKESMIANKFIPAKNLKYAGEMSEYYQSNSSKSTFVTNEQSINYPKYKAVRNDIGAVLLTTVGIAAAIPSGGTSIGVLGGVSLSLGIPTLGLGLGKTILDIQGETTKANEVPSGVFNAFGRGIGREVGDEQLGEAIGGVGESLLNLRKPNVYIEIYKKGSVLEKVNTTNELYQIYDSNSKLQSTIRKNGKN